MLPEATNATSLASSSNTLAARDVYMTTRTLRLSRCACSSVRTAELPAARKGSSPVVISDSCSSEAEPGPLRMSPHVDIPIRAKLEPLKRFRSELVLELEWTAWRVGAFDAPREDSSIRSTKMALVGAMARRARGRLASQGAFDMHVPPPPSNSIARGLGDSPLSRLKDLITPEVCAGLARDGYAVVDGALGDEAVDTLRSELVAGWGAGLMHANCTHLVRPEGTELLPKHSVQEADLLDQARARVGSRPPAGRASKPPVARPWQNAAPPSCLARRRARKQISRWRRRCSATRRC